MHTELSVVTVAGFFCILVSTLVPQDVWGDVQVFEMTKDQAVVQAKQNSERLRASASDRLAALEQADAAQTLLLPRLTLDGSFHYVTQVPSIQIPLPGFGGIPIGANTNYSVGPTLSYTLWDSGSARNAYKSQLKLSESKEEEEKNAVAQLVGSVKSAYVQVQLELEQLAMVQDTLKLSRAQDEDIAHRFRAGTATQLELLTANRDVLGYELQLKQQQAGLASSLRDLLALTSERSIRDPSRPAPVGFVGATVWLKLESLVKTLEAEGTNEPLSFNSDSPQLKSQEFLADALELTSRSQLAGAYPQLQISARSSLDYPNGPIIQMINQNTFGATLSMPLFEFSRTRHQAAEKEKEADSARHRKNQMRTDLDRDFLKTKELLVSLRQQQKDAEESVKQSETLARLNYESYRIGRITLVDAQAANVRALQAKVDLTKIRAQTLGQIILLKTLIGKEN